MVKHTVSTPINIVVIMNRHVAQTAIVVGCVDHHEYSLFRMEFILSTIKRKEGNIQRCRVHRLIYSSEDVIGDFFFLIVNMRILLIS